MDFQTTNIVKAPNSAGKNLTKKISLPRILIKKEIQDVTGGTDKYPKAK
jgi:hypothetical protein